ncbi:MAG: endonuclease/exonuclease/phosphatase family protein [Saprospiraceae bacterium]|nr:endonuclease/exonuclease/phosphatase family protein [Saprospiraceae bacterium]
MFERLTPQKQLFQRVASAVLIVGALLCIYQPENHLLRGFTRYAAQITVAYWFLGLLFLVLKNARLTMVSFICCGFLCLFLKGMSDSKVAKPQVAHALQISVAQINISLSNSKYAETIDAIKKTHADVLSLQEVDLEWSNRLKDSLSVIYPYRCRVDKVDLYGIEIYSKYPFASSDTFYTAINNMPNLVVSLKKTASSRPIFVVSTYFMPPLFTSAYFTMQQQMKTLADYIHAIKDPLLTVGDYNIESSSWEIQQFRQQAGLLNSRRGFRPTRADGQFDLTEVPTDHIFFTPHLECNYFETIVGAKNEHLGILGSFQLTNLLTDAEKTD